MPCVPKLLSKRILRLSLTVSALAVASLGSTSFWLSPVVTPAFAEGGNARTENITFDTDIATYKIKAVELHGTALTDATLAALLDPKDKASISERFAKLTAAEVLIPEIVLITKNEPIQTVTYRNVKLSDVTAGKASNADIEGAQVIIAQQKDTPPVDGTYGRMQARAIDLTLAARILTETRKDDSEPLKPLYESFTGEKIVIRSGGKDSFTFTIGGLSGHGVKARPLMTRPTDLQAQGKDPKVVAAFLKDVLLSVEIGDSEAKNIEMTGLSDGKPVTASMGKMSIAGFADGKTREIDFGPMAISTPDADIKIDGINVKDLDFPKLREKLPASTAPAGDTEAEASEQMRLFTPAVGKLSVDKIEVAVKDADKPAPTIAFALARFSVEGGIPPEGKPAHTTLALDNLTIDLSALKDKDVKSITDMGYSKLDVSSRVEMTWQPDTEKLTVNDISVTGVDMGKVKVTGLLDNVNKDFFSGDATAMQAAALGALIKQVELTVENNGLFERAVAVQAKTQGKSAEDIKRSYVNAAAVGLPAMLDNKPAAKTIGAALARFVATPKNFQVTAKSADGLGAADFALISDPGTLLDSIEVTATANK